MQQQINANYDAFLEVVLFYNEMDLLVLAKTIIEHPSEERTALHNLWATNNIQGAHSNWAKQLADLPFLLLLPDSNADLRAARQHPAPA